MKALILYLSLIASFSSLNASELDNSLSTITNFHFVSEKLASSGLIEFEKYNDIKTYGFKHVINLIPGDQAIERKKVESLGMSYEQIQVAWDEPTLDDFERFTALMKSYGKDKVYVHCEANFRASTFVFLYRTTQLGINKAIANKDLSKIWKPSETWQGYIEKVQFSEEE